MPPHGDPVLPWEIILVVIEELSPSNPKAILPASHKITKTLLALTLVSRATNPTASTLLWRHCLCIDSPRKANALARCLSHPHEPSQDKLHSSPRAIVSLYLGPFAEIDTDANHIAAPLDDLSTATCVHEILLAAEPDLRRLVVDMPLRSLRPDNDARGVRPLLADAFDGLINLEELASIQDDLYVGTEPRQWWSDPWAGMDNLRRLMLYNPQLDGWPCVWSEVSRLALHHLEMVIWARADFDAYNGLNAYENPLLDQPTATNGVWLNARPVYHSHHRRPPELQHITVVLVDVKDHQPEFVAGSSPDCWPTIDPEGRTRVLFSDAPFLKESTGDKGARTADADCLVKSTQQFLRKHALEGTLWDEEAMMMYKAPTRLVIGT